MTAEQVLRAHANHTRGRDVYYRVMKDGAIAHRVGLDANREYKPTLLEALLDAYDPPREKQLPIR